MKYAISIFGLINFICLYLLAYKVLVPDNINEVVTLHLCSFLLSALYMVVQHLEDGLK